MGLDGTCCPVNDASCVGDGACTDGNITFAAFLIARPPYGYIGSGWLGCDNVSKPLVHTWHPLFDLDVGEPLELCQEHEPGIFSRRWSRGSASLDCNTFSTSLNFTQKQLQPSWHT